MTETTPNAYLRTKVMTAGPAELRLMLFDGAIKFAEQGKASLESKGFESAYTALSRAQNIVMELISSLRPKHDPELCERLSALYTYVYNRLVSAVTERRVDYVDEALGLLRFERETWSLLIERLAQENRKANAMLETPSATATHPGAQGDPSSLVGGRVSLQG